MNKWQNSIYLSGGLLMVVGAGCYCFLLWQQVMCWIFLFGACMFAIMQMMQTYEGKSPVIHRLKRIQNVANILFIFAGISMVDTVYTFTEKWLGNPQLFYSIFYGKWIMVMLVASILELYTTFRISHEMKGGECK